MTTFRLTLDIKQQLRTFLAAIRRRSAYGIYTMCELYVAYHLNEHATRRSPLGFTMFF